MENSTAARHFWEKVDRTDNCWCWTGPVDKDGYGKTTIRGVTRRAHRVAWEFAKGPIPKGLFVLHRCDNPPCCNPAHLFVGTNSDNMRDAASKGRMPGQKKTHCPAGHEYTAENTRVERNAQGWTMRSCVECDRAYYKTWYVDNRAKKIAASTASARAAKEGDPAGFRARAAEYTRAYRARKKAASSHS